MARKYRGGEKEEWEVEGLYRFYRFEPGMSKRPLPHAED